MINVEKLLENIYLIDAKDLGMNERTGAYVLTERDLTIIETSASPSVPHIIAGIKELGYSLEDIKYIIVTHIHLDHSGGAGLLLKDCPNATIVVHPKGRRHLVDPTRLIAGAKAVYGEKFDSLFDPVIPIPCDRIIEKNDKDTLEIGTDCTLTFYDTPGHANHHFSIFHPKVHGMFTGDTCGIFYRTLTKDNVEFYLPTTSPNQFNPKKMLQSISLFKEMELKHVFFGHYGMSSNPNEAFRQVSEWLNVFLSTGEESIQQEEMYEKQVERTAANLLEQVKSDLLLKGIPEDHEIYDIIALDMQICAMGIIDYLQKRK